MDKYILKFIYTTLIKKCICLIQIISYENYLFPYGKKGNAIGKIIMLTTVAMIINGNPAFT